MFPRTIARRLVRWFVGNARDLPWRRSLDPYALWVSEIMLQQTQVRTVLPYFERWLRELPTIDRLAAATPERLHKLWEGLGYYTRVRNLQRAAQAVVNVHNGVFPSGFDALLALPGIGRYTAGAITSIAFNQAQPIVDGNVIRVLCRLRAIRGNPKERRINAKLWTIAGELVDAARQMKPVVPPPGSRLKLAGNCSALNQALMELGATVCTPVNPRCAVCPLRGFCAARRLNRIDDLPKAARRPPVTSRRFVALVIRQNGRVLVRQRPAGGVNAHLWEFPNAEIALTEVDPVAAAAADLRATLGNVRPLGRIRHAITRYRITMECFAATSRGRIRVAAGRWVPSGRIGGLAFASAHQKLWLLANPGAVAAGKKCSEPD